MAAIHTFEPATAIGECTEFRNNYTAIKVRNKEEAMAKPCLADGLAHFFLLQAKSAWQLAKVRIENKGGLFDFDFNV